MRLKTLMLAGVLGVGILAAPVIASAMPINSYNCANAAARLSTMGPKQRYLFMREHPFLAHHRYLVNDPYACGPAPTVAPGYYGFGRHAHRHWHLFR